MKKWVKVGLVWGFAMLVMMTFVFPYFNKEEISLKSVILKFVTWVFIGGLFFGYVMKKNFKD